MTSLPDSSGASAGDRARSRAYLRDFLPGVGGYLVALLAVLRWGGLDGDDPWRAAWALLPVLPALWIVRAVVRHLHRVDDYQRLLLLQGLGVGFVTAMVTALTVGFLGIAGLDGRASGFVVYGAGMLGWLVAGALSRRAGAGA